MEQIKPCPFCGSEADTYIDSHYQDRFVVECENCGTDVRYEYSMEGAIRSWNERRSLIPVAIQLVTDATTRYIDFDPEIKDHEYHVSRMFGEKLISYEILYKEKNNG